MSRAMINFLLDAALLAAFLLLVGCSVIVRFVFPPGPDAKGWALWSLNYDQWAGIQFGLIATLALGFLLHVMLHWTWVCGMVAKCLSGKGKVDDGVQTLYGVGFLIVILNIVGGFVAAAALTIQRP